MSLFDSLPFRLSIPDRDLIEQEEKREIAITTNLTYRTNNSESS